MPSGLSRGEQGVLAFTAAYMAGFAAWFLSLGNREFLWYILTMLVLIGLVFAMAKTSPISTSMVRMYQRNSRFPSDRNQAAKPAI